MRPGYLQLKHLTPPCPSAESSSLCSAATPDLHKTNPGCRVPPPTPHPPGHPTYVKKAPHPPASARVCSSIQSSSRRRRWSPLCVLTLLLPARLFPLLPLLYSASATLPPLPPLTTALLSLVTEGGLALNGMHGLIHHTAAQEANTPQSGGETGANLQSDQRGPAADGDCLMSSEPDRRSPFSTPPPFCKYRHKRMHHGSYSRDKGPQIRLWNHSKVSRRFQSINHIFVRLRGGQQGD